MKTKKQNKTKHTPKQTTKKNKIKQKKRERKKIKINSTSQHFSHGIFTII